MLVAPLLAAAGTFGVLRTLASFDVRDSAEYLAFYMTIGAAWAFVGSGSWVGVLVRDDVAERGNKAALLAWSGAVIGSSACYAGANIGDGPGWWCVFWAGGLGMLGWALCWMALDSTTGAADHVTIDRDLAAGLRVGSFLAAAGVLLGRGAAGDWTSALDTVLEMRAAWPVLILLAKAIVLERFTRPSPEAPQGRLFLEGVVPALLDIAIVWLGLILAGPLPNDYVAPAGAP
jgi:hypothetical protein